MPTATERPDHDRWLGVEVRHLAALRAVAEEGTFGAAALRLGYAQSAISAQIAALERYVGRRLFDRPGGSRPVTLTRAGGLLLQHAEAIMTRLNAARIDLDSLVDEAVSGALRVGIYQSAARTILPLVLQELGAEPDELDLELKESNDERELLDCLERGDLDLTFTALPLPPGPFDAVPLVDDPYVLLVHEDHELASLDRELSLEEIAAVPLVTFKRCSSQAKVEEVFAAHALSPRVVLRVEDNVTLHGFVAAGLGCGLVPRLAADVEGKPLVALEVDRRVPPRIVAIAWHRDRLRTCTQGLFVDLSIEAAGKLVAASAVAAAAAG